MVDTGLTYDGERPVHVRIRRRGRNYTLDDDGAAVTLAGKPPGWLDAAEGAVREVDLNINRRGVVFVSAFEHSVDRDWLVGRVAEASLGVYAALLELQD